MQTVRLAKKELTEKDLTKIDFASAPLDFDEEFARARKQFYVDEYKNIENKFDKFLCKLGFQILVGINNPKKSAAKGVN